MLLNKFLTYHRNAAIEDIEFLYEFDLIGDTMDVEDYMIAVQYLKEKETLKQRNEKIKAWFTKALSSMKRNFEEVQF